MWKLMISLPDPSRIHVCCDVPWSGKKHELFENGCSWTICTTYGAGKGAVEDTAISKLIGLESMTSELGDILNHFSTSSLEMGFRRFSRVIEEVPKTLTGPAMGKLKDEEVISSKTSSPVGSHRKTANCFSPDWSILICFLVLKITSGCFLPKETKRLLLQLAGNPLIPAISSIIWMRIRNKNVNTVFQQLVVAKLR